MSSLSVVAPIHPLQLLEMEYDDGGAPPLEIIRKWLDVVRSTFQNAPDSSGPNGPNGPAIAVHCVAGLGRAPVLVAIALIEYGKVSSVTLLHLILPINDRVWYFTPHSQRLGKCKIRHEHM